WAAGKVEGAQFLPDLAQGINSVAAIEVTHAGKTLTVERSGQAWRLRDRSGYPAKSEPARTLLVALAGSQLVEPRTSVKDKLSLLELEDPTAKDAKSRRVRVLDASGKALADAILGKTRFDAFGSGKGGMYVRRASETQSWLATGDPRVTADVKDWVDTKVLAVETAKVAKVIIESPGEAPLVIERTPPAPKDAAAKDGKAPPPPPSAEKPAKYQLAKMPDDKKLKSAGAVDDVVDALGSVDLDDVRKLDATPAGDAVQIVKVESDGGLGLTLRLRKDGEARWLSVSAAGGEGDAKKKADEINARAQGWEFKIPTWKADQIGKRAADLFEAKAS
ncbi:MAG: DUF4340 domain-containing protein, partial [Hyphomicrobiaceae bacterium]